MRKFIIIFCCFLFFSCKVQKTTLLPFVEVYKSNWVGGNIYPSYIILRTQPKNFEIYAPGIYESVFGSWRIKNDTLYLIPQNKILCKDSDFLIRNVENDSTILTIPQQYVIKKDSLIDVTNYNFILQKFNMSSETRTVFKRVTNQ